MRQSVFVGGVFDVASDGPAGNVLRNNNDQIANWERERDSLGGSNREEAADDFRPGVVLTTTAVLPAELGEKKVGRYLVGTTLPEGVGLELSFLGAEHAPSY